MFFCRTLANRSIVSGYTCGGVGEPCIGPGNLPYYRPNTNVSRGQISKISYLAITYPPTR